MPQMSPLNWLNLLLFSVSIFLMFNAMNYSSIYYLNIKNKPLKKLIINWKW